MAAPSAIPIRKSARMTVKTYVSPPVPEASSRVQVDLVAERRQARDERDRRAGSQTIRLGRWPWRPVAGGGSRPLGRAIGRGSATAAVSAGKPQRDETGDTGADRPDAEGAGQPEQLDQDESGEERSDDRAHRVGGVQAAERLAERERAREVAHEGREGGAHHDRGRCQGEDGQDEARQREERRALERRVDAAIDIVDEPERQRASPARRRPARSRAARTAAAANARGRRSGRRSWPRSPSRRRSR